MNAHEKFVALLEEFGYEKADYNTDPKDLGHLEYIDQLGGGKRMVTIGAGQSGDHGCFTVFYFTLDSGEFLSHGTSNESDDVD